VGGPDADLVAAHTFDTSEYLINLHNAEGTELDTDFTVDIADTISYHVPCHVKAQNIGPCSQDLMRLAGAQIAEIDQCSGVDGMWGFKAGNEGLSIPIAQKLAAKITDADNALVVGDCHLANTAMVEQSGQVPQHPLQVLARAYGIAEEPIA
jgi:Fe-S oxidoreductase